MRASTLRIMVIILILLGMLFSLITLLAKQEPEAFCQPGGCESVLTSSYAFFLGIPLSIWGVLYYALLLAAFLTRRSRAYAVLLTLGLLISTYLTMIEFTVLHAICPYCLSSAVIILTLSLYHTASLYEKRMMSVKTV